jgi:hypothetical protein
MPRWDPPPDPESVNHRDGRTWTWKELGIDPPHLAGEPTPENAAWVRRARERYTILKKTGQLRPEPSDEEVQAVIDRGGNFGDIVELYRDTGLEVKWTET